MATTATLTYTVDPVVIPAAALAAALAAVALPTSDLLPFGVSLTSDSTAVVAGKAVRTVVLSLVPIFISFAPIVSPAGFQFQGSAVSSSPEDSLAGSGARQLFLRGTDSTGAVVTISVALNGTTPVPLIMTTGGKKQVLGPVPIVTPFGVTSLHQITSIAITETGPSGTNAGTVSIYSNLVGGGDMMAQIPITPATTWQGSIVSTSEADTAGGVGAQSILINYLDGSGAPQTETIPLNGTTPVPLVAFDHATITGMSVATAGALTANVGMITVKQGLNVTGGIAGQLAPSFSGTFTTTATRFAVFSGIYQQILSAGIASFVAEGIVIT